MKRTILLLIIAMRAGVNAAMLLPAVHAQAAEPAPNAANEAAAASRMTTSEYMAMRCLRAEPGAGEPRELDAHPQSLLRWSNPEIGRVYGNVFVWTDAGRPAAVVSLYRFYLPWQSLSAEFVALTPQPALTVEHNGRILWAPNSGGLEWKPLPDAPTPAANAAARLRQMRLLAGRFSAALSDRRTGDSGEQKQTRLLRQPIFRYPEIDGRTDGGMFAFVVGTDPELLVLLETRGDSRPQWHYALARMNRDPLEVRLDGQRVWNAPHLGGDELGDSRRPYCILELPLPTDGPAGHDRNAVPLSRDLKQDQAE